MSDGGWFHKASNSTIKALRSLNLGPSAPSDFNPLLPRSEAHGEYDEDDMSRTAYDGSDSASYVQRLPQARYHQHYETAQPPPIASSSTPYINHQEHEYAGQWSQDNEQPAYTIYSTQNNQGHMHQAQQPQPSPAAPQRRRPTFLVGGASGHGQHTQQSRPPPPPPPPKLGPYSTAGFPSSIIYAAEFMLGSGMVIIQPSTGRIVVVNDTRTQDWFFPKGRKDVGESLEQAALREAYEESGYVAEFLPLFIPSNAPTPPEQRELMPKRNTEPVYLSTHQWHNRRAHQHTDASGGEYITFWYVGQIPADATRTENTGMADEQSYVAHLLDYNAALDRLDYKERAVLERAYNLWIADAEIEAYWTGQVAKYQLAQAREDRKGKARARQEPTAMQSASGDGDEESLDA